MTITWRATRLGGGVLCGENVIAFIPDNPERKANADLIASVPDMVREIERLQAIETAARAYVEWSGFGYEGRALHRALEEALKK